MLILALDITGFPTDRPLAPKHLPETLPPTHYAQHRYLRLSGNHLCRFAARFWMNQTKESSAELTRLQEDREGRAAWKKWGPYLSERQWGTVREDYSSNGDAWNYF